MLRATQSTASRSLVRSLTLVLFVSALPAEGAIFSLIQTRGEIATEPSQTHVIPSNVKDGSAEPMMLDAAGDDAIASASLMGTDGFLMLNSHACSGPALGGPGGTASTTSNVNYFEDFVIQSDTLPVGTPVTITFKLAAARSFRADVIQPFPIRLGDAAVAAAASVRFYTDISGGRSFQGDFGAQQIGYEPITRGMSGIFATSSGPPEEAGDRDAGEFIATLPGTVGGQFFINLETQVGATSGAGNPVEADADGQMSLSWGAEVDGGLAQIRTPGGTLFPPTSNATEENALSN